MTFSLFQSQLIRFREQTISVILCPHQPINIHTGDRRLILPNEQPIVQLAFPSALVKLDCKTARAIKDNILFPNAQNVNFVPPTG
jgi:hypothetical protein